MVIPVKEIRPGYLWMRLRLINYLLRIVCGFVQAILQISTDDQMSLAQQSYCYNFKTLNLAKNSFEQ